MVAAAALLLLPARAAASEPVELRAVVDAAYTQDYRLASELLDRLPDDAPGTLFWRAGLLQLLIYDSGNKALVDSFHRLSDSAAARCRVGIRADSRDARAYLYLGLTELNRASMLSWEQQKLRAFTTMLRVTPSLGRARRLAPEMSEASFGLGVVEYFKSCANRYALGLRLFGSRERAYGLLRQVESGDAALQPMAVFMLGFMYKEDRQYDSAGVCCRRLLERYPGNRSTARLLRDVLLKAGRAGEALEVALDLWRDIDTVWPTNYYGLAENWLKMAEAYELLGRTEQAAGCADLVIAWEPWQDDVPWLRNYVREAKQLRARVWR